jgi:hypothetical protein
MKGKKDQGFNIANRGGRHGRGRGRGRGHRGGRGNGDRTDNDKKSMKLDVGVDIEEVEVMEIGPTMIKNLRLSVTIVMNTCTLQKSVPSQTVENNG